MSKDRLRRCWLNCIAVFLLAVSLWPAHGLDADQTNGPAITSISQFLKVSSREAENHLPVRIEGVVIRSNPQMRTVTLMDGEFRLEVSVPPRGERPKIGQTVICEGITDTRIQSRYPETPGEVYYPTNFEGPSGNMEWHVSRLRGLVAPPETGQYSFWISSDDDSELYFSTNASPEQARVIASVSGWNTARYAWNEQSNQHSAAFYLEAGKRYYLEARHRNGNGQSFVGVAWDGPGIERQIIKGRYLSPWVATPQPQGSASEVKGSILLERWPGMGASLSDLGLKPVVLSPPFISAIQFSIKSASAEDVPQIQPEDPVSIDQEYTWVEVEGEVTALSEKDGNCSVELSQGKRHMTALIEDIEGGAALHALLGTRIRVSGLCQSRLDITGQRVAGLVTVSGLEHVQLVEGTRVPLRSVEEILRKPSALPAGQRVRIRGRVVELGEGILSLDSGGSHITSFISEDGTNWNTVGEATIHMKEAAAVGICVCSHDTNQIGAAQFGLVDWLGTNWQNVDVDGALPAGSVEKNATGLVVKGGGADIEHETQQFHFVNRTMPGNLDLITKVEKQDNTHRWAKAGIMIRDSAAGRSKFAGVYITPGQGVQFQYRNGESGNSSAADRSAWAPCWLRLTRSYTAVQVMPVQTEMHVKLGQWLEVVGILDSEGSQTRVKHAFIRSAEENWNQAPALHLAQVFRPAASAFDGRNIRVRGRISEVREDGTLVLDDDVYNVAASISENGGNWLDVTNVVLNMRREGYGGLAVCSHSDETPVRAVFNQVAGLGRNWTNIDIGNPKVKGSVKVNGAQFEVTAGGRDIYVDKQEFHFVHRPLRRSGSVGARVESIDSDNLWSKAGVQIREKLTESSKYIGLVLTPGNGIELQTRMVDSGDVTSQSFPAKAPYSLRLNRSFRTVLVRLSRAPAAPKRGQWVEVLGALEWRDSGMALNDASWRPSDPTPDEIPDSDQPAPTDTQVVTAIGELWRLPQSEIKKGYPVRMRGTVTFRDGNRLTVQDATAGILALGETELLGSVAVGDVVEAEGRSEPGEISPHVQLTGIDILGPGMMPEPITTSLDRLAASKKEAQWIEMKGIAQAVTTNRIDLAVEGGEIKAVFPVAFEAGRVSKLAGSVARVRGVAIAPPGGGGRMDLYVPSIDWVSIDQPAIPEPFDLATQDISSLSHSGVVGDELRFVKIAGTVIYSVPGVLFVQDSGGVLRVLTRKKEEVVLGDWIEAVGFLVIEDNIPSLKQAATKKKGGNVPLAPMELTQDALAQAQNALRLVSMEAVFLGHSRVGRDEVLQLQVTNRIFQAILPFDESARITIEPGSVVKVAGISQFLTQNAGVGAENATQFRLLMSSGRDLIVLRGPQGVALKRTLTVIGALGAVLLLAAAWIRILREQVERQTALLKTEIEERRAIAADLIDKKNRLETEVEERKRVQLEAERAHKELVAASRQAGMAEVATSVLHNVGNVLNSVNVSASIIVAQIRQSRIASVARLAELLRQHLSDLAHFISNDPKGKQLPEYVSKLSEQLAAEQEGVLKELGSLQKNIDHIKDIVAMQQSYAKIGGVVELTKPGELVEDALRMNTGSLTRHDVELVREIDPAVPSIAVDKHKVLQILVNLLRNARQACDESGKSDKRISISVKPSGDRVRIAVADNGVGITAENMTRIFSHGFTTRKDGHGFGLHSSALAAKEMGGALTAGSDGAGKGAVFTLELPIEQQVKKK